MAELKPLLCTEPTWTEEEIVEFWASYDPEVDDMPMTEGDYAVDECFDDGEFPDEDGNVMDSAIGEKSTGQRESLNSTS